MKFEEFEARLNELLDRREPLELPEEMRAAAAADAECLRLYRAYQALSAAMAARPRPEPPIDLAGRVLLQLGAHAAGDEPAGDDPLGDCSLALVAEPASAAAESPAGARRRAQPWLIWTATAASVALLVLALRGRFAGPERPPAPEPGSVAVQPSPEDTPAGHDAERTAAAFADVSQLVREQYASLAAETRASWADMAVLVPPVPMDVMPMDVLAAAEPGALPTEAAIGRESEDASSLRESPFRESTRGAVGLLMRFAPR